MTASRRDLPSNRRVPSMAPPSNVVNARAERVGTGRSGKAAPRNVTSAAKARLLGALDILKLRLGVIRTAVGIVLVVTASIALAWGIRQHVMTSPRFAVRAIRVDGIQRRTPEQVVQTAGLQVGMNIFAADLEGARRRLLQDPWVETATVDRKLPTTLTVVVQEREAAAAVAIGQELYLCTHDGEPFKPMEPGDPSKLVVVTGIVPDEVAQSRTSVVRRIRAALALVDEYEHKGPAKEYAAQEVHVANDGTMRLTVGRDAVTIEMGLPPYRRKVLRAAQVLNEVSRRKAEASVVFLDNEAHPERVVVRMR